MNRSPRLAILAFALSVPFAAQAHKAWLQPSQTVLAGTNSWVTVDAAVSNDLFYFNHVPLRTDNLSIVAPDGSRVDAQNSATGKYRTVFDVELKQQGTYRIGIINDYTIAQWDDNGQPKRWRGTPASFATEVPKDAKNLQVSQSISRVETYVTNGKPSDGVLKSSGLGLELVAVTHPNDLFAGEPAKFRLLVDGKPAVGLDVEIVRGDTRYRNAQDEIKIKTGSEGEFSVTWPEAGMYWLEATTQDEKTTAPQARQRRLGYVVTLEVLPQ